MVNRSPSKTVHTVSLLKLEKVPVYGELLVKLFRTINTERDNRMNDSLIISCYFFNKNSGRVVTY